LDSVVPDEGREIKRSADSCDFVFALAAGRQNNVAVFRSTILSGSVHMHRTVLVGIIVIAAAAFASRLPDVIAQDQAKPAAIATKDLSLAQAQKAIEAAVAKSRDIDAKMNVAVVDAGGNLKAFARMDGAWLGSIDIAMKKARTARYFDMPTGEIGKLSQPGGPLYQIEVSNDGLITFPGGVPIKAADGTVIGAVGVSGDTVEKDHAVAAAAADALK
jgi:uncharacterized protein GlcG (DUF336 family)